MLNESGKMVDEQLFRRIAIKNLDYLGGGMSSKRRARIFSALANWSSS